MINIKYGYFENIGEMNIDIVKFVENRNIKDIKFLCKKVVAISWNRAEITKEIIKICNEQITKEKDKYAIFDITTGTKMWFVGDVRLIKRYERFIEFLEKMGG